MLQYVSVEDRSTKLKEYTMIKTIQMLCMSAVGIVAANVAAAPGDSEQSESRTIEEIVVTATYRETNLMDTPQSISAVTDDMVEDLGAISISDIFNTVPGLLARSHFAMLEEGAPHPFGHWNKAIFSYSIGDGSDGA